MKKEQLYFKNTDHTICYSLEWFLDEAKEQRLEEINLIRAVIDKDTKDFVWCSEYSELIERYMCKKSECETYFSKSDRGACSNRGKLYYHGEEVVIDVESGKEK